MSLSVSLFGKAGTLAVAITLLGAGIATVPPLQQIVTLEQHRSLGSKGELAAFLRDPDERIAARAALAIGRTKQAWGVSLLQAHLRDERTGVRAMAVYGLGVIGRPASLEAIAAMARSDASGAVRVGAVDALQRWETGGALKARDERLAFAAVASALRGDADPIVRGRGAIALTAFAQSKLASNAAGLLVDAIHRERDNYVRERVMWAIFRTYAARVPQSVLAARLGDTDEVVRIEAVRAYGKLKGDRYLPTLEPLTRDPSWRVQEQARESMRLVKGRKQTEHLTKTPRDTHIPYPQPDPFAKIAALPRTRGLVSQKPNASQALYDTAIDPHTAADMTQPAKGVHPRVRFVTTKGNVYLTLFPEWAPLTVANFLNLANNGFYDNNPWFRIVPDFVVQTGEKDAVKQPGPGYAIGAEENPMEQDSYVLAMGLDYDQKTSTPKRDSAGSEYYITLSPQFHLNLPFSVFGRVTSGEDVLGRLNESDKVVRVERLPDVTI